MSPFYAWKVTRANGDGHVMRVRLKGIGSICLRACENDFATVEEILLKRVYDGVVSAIDPPATVIDLGANIGLVARYFAAAWPGSRIFCVEAHPETFGLLARNTATCGRIRCLHAAAWSEEKDLSIECADLNFESAHAVEAGAGFPARGLPMDRLMELSGFERVDLLKVDIEGAETQLFSGPCEWLERVGAIAIEFHGNSREESGFDSKVQAFGFAITAPDKGHTCLALKAPSSKRRPARRA